jgi:hypothetical protein
MLTTGTLALTGSVTGGSGYSAYGILKNAGTVSVSGDVTGGGGSIASGIHNIASGTTLSNTTRLINGTKAIAFTGYPPVWQPTAATYMYWYTGASFGQAPDTEFVRNLTAAEIKKGTVSGSVTGTYASGDIIGNSALVRS